jgi:hypothetical protein
LSFLEEGAAWEMGNRLGALATFVNGVWVDPSTGGLDFFYQIQNSFPARLGAAPDNSVSSSFTLDGFASAPITGVFQLSSTIASTAGCAFFAGGQCPPGSVGLGFLRPTSSSILSVTRGGGTGATLTVDLSGPVAAGTRSAILVVQTSSQDFDASGSGTFSWLSAPPSGATGSGPGQDTGGPWVLDALTPVAPAPEPGASTLLTLCVTGLLLFGRRQANKAGL